MLLLFLFARCFDVMTLCHDVTKPYSAISACRRARKLIFFISMVFWVTEFENIIIFFICVML